jgi:hypothetical protein
VLPLRYALGVDWFFDRAGRDNERDEGHVTRDEGAGAASCVAVSGNDGRGAWKLADKLSALLCGTPRDGMTALGAHFWARESYPAKSG